MATAVELVRRFRGLRALVIGDAMLDSYLEGTATRLCSEEPVPVVRKTDEARARRGGEHRRQPAGARRRGALPRPDRARPHRRAPAGGAPRAGRG